MTLSTALRRNCTKIRYRDHREAVAVLHKIAGHRNRAEAYGLDSRRREIRSYRCDGCNGFHLTSKEAWG